MVDLIIRSVIVLAIVVPVVFFAERLGSGNATETSDAKPEAEAHENERR